MIVSLVRIESGATVKRRSRSAISIGFWGPDAAGLPYVADTAAIVWTLMGVRTEHDH